MMWKRTRLKPEAPPSSCSPPPNEKATASSSEPKRQTELTMKIMKDNERPFLKVLSEERRWRPQSRSSRRAMACYGVLWRACRRLRSRGQRKSSPRRRRSASRKMSRYRRQLQQEEGASARGAMGTLAMPRKRDEADEARMKLLLYVALQFQQLSTCAQPRITPVYLCARLQSQSRIIAVNNFSSARSQATFTAFYVVTSRFPFLRLVTLRSSLLSLLPLSARQ